MLDRKLVIAVLFLVAVGAALYGLLYPYISGGLKAQKRQAALISGGPARKVEARIDPAKRRKAISESLKEIEDKKRNKSVTLEQKIEQAGLGWSVQVFYLGSAVAGLFFCLVVYVGGGNEIFTLVSLLAGGLALPRWLLSFLAKRRTGKFIELFPDALDVIIRGVKAGLPVADCLRVIATEAQEPVRSEFRRIVDAQTIGMTVSEAVERLAESVPVSETAFFAVVINIQQKAGGNLSEALGNLARVLRERKKMKGKVKAMSAEAKSSAGIIGSLPFLVGAAVTFTNPSYMALLYTTTLGQICLAGGLVWMGIGVAIMHKMINFDF
jgi:tight adherence protein B